MKTLSKISFILFLSLEKLMSCPMCSGSENSIRDRYTVYILATFILLVYIPYYLVFRKIKNFEKVRQEINEQHYKHSNTSSS